MDQEAGKPGFAQAFQAPERTPVDDRRRRRRSRLAGSRASVLVMMRERPRQGSARGRIRRCPEGGGVEGVDACARRRRGYGGPRPGGAATGAVGDAVIEAELDGAQTQIHPEGGPRRPMTLVLVGVGPGPGRGEETAPGVIGFGGFGKSPGAKPRRR